MSDTEVESVYWLPVFIDDMGSVCGMNGTGSLLETPEENWLWSLNSMREHDGLEPMGLDDFRFDRETGEIVVL